PIAHDEHDLVSPLGELPQLPQADSVPDVQAGMRRVESLFDPEPSLAGRQGAPQVLPDDDLRHPAREELLELTLVRSDGHGLSLEFDASRARRRAIMRSGAG